MLVLVSDDDQIARSMTSRGRAWLRPKLAFQVMPLVGASTPRVLKGITMMRMPALCLRIDAGFAGPVAVPGGVVFAVAGVHDVGDAAVEGVVSAGGVGALGEAVKEWLGGIRGEVEVDGFLIGEKAVAVEGGEGGRLAEFGFGAEVEGFVVVEEADGRVARQRVQRREEREGMRGGVLPLGAVEREFGGRFGDGELS
jgi:hypothetical protein